MPGVAFFFCVLFFKRVVFVPNYAAIRGGGDAGGSHSAEGEVGVVPPNAHKAGDEGLSGVA